MDLLRVCVVLTLCVAMMTQIVLSAPAFSQDLDTIDDSQFEDDPDTVLALEQRDVADSRDIADSTDVADSRDVADSSQLYSRIRRQFAQMDASRVPYDCRQLSGSRRRNCIRRHSRSRSRSRGHGRGGRFRTRMRIYKLRTNGGGQVTDW